jgi:hypothetical protein
VIPRLVRFAKSSISEPSRRRWTGVYAGFMREIIDFYRRNPLVLALVAAGGLALSLAVAASAGDGIVLPIVFVALVGVLVGLGIAWTRRRP